MVGLCTSKYSLCDGVSRLYRFINLKKGFLFALGSKEPTVVLFYTKSVLKRTTNLRPDFFGEKHHKTFERCSREHAEHRRDPATAHQTTPSVRFGTVSKRPHSDRHGTISERAPQRATAPYRSAATLPYIGGCSSSDACRVAETAQVSLGHL